ncbi:related to NAD(P)H-dependent oxidoreductase [Fusarium fujikuroi]|nr:related to NAD(P)H-dependent oxidoreductase [Fusarium fujikuroi]
MSDAKALSEHFLKTEPQQWAATLKTNLTGPYYMSMAFLPLLAKGHETIPGYSSHIINVPSISGAMKGSSMGQPAYATSKAALTKDVKVRVNVIAPGLFPSEMTTEESDEGNKSNIDKKMTNPAGQPGHDSDMAATILLLAGKGGFLQWPDCLSRWRFNPDQPSDRKLKLLFLKEFSDIGIARRHMVVDN